MRIREERSERGRLFQAAWTVPQQGSPMGRSCRRSCCSSRDVVPTEGRSHEGRAESDKLRRRGRSLRAWGSVTHMVGVLSQHLGLGVIQPGAWHQGLACRRGVVG